MTSDLENVVPGVQGVYLIQYALSTINGQPAFRTYHNRDTMLDPLQSDTPSKVITNNSFAQLGVLKNIKVPIALRGFMLKSGQWIKL